MARRHATGGPGPAGPGAHIESVESSRPRPPRRGPACEVQRIRFNRERSGLGISVRSEPSSTPCPQSSPATPHGSVRSGPNEILRCAGDVLCCARGVDANQHHEHSSRRMLPSCTRGGAMRWLVRGIPSVRPSCSRSTNGSLGGGSSPIHHPSIVRALPPIPTKNST